MLLAVVGAHAWPFLSWRLNCTAAVAAAAPWLGLMLLMHWFLAVSIPCPGHRVVATTGEEVCVRQEPDMDKLKKDLQVRSCGRSGQQQDGRQNLVYTRFRHCLCAGGMPM